mgnify:CR=1 FL=1
MRSLDKFPCSFASATNFFKVSNASFNNGDIYILQSNNKVAELKLTITTHIMFETIYSDPSNNNMSDYIAKFLFTVISANKISGSGIRTIINNRTSESKKRAISKWNLLYTLFRNQSLKMDRKLKNSKIVSQNTEITILQKKLEDEIKNSARLNTELIELRSLRTQNENIKNQYEAVKGQLNHLETFKSELSKSREETVKVKSDYEKTILGLKQEHQSIVEDLNKKIEYLQLTPAKRKKIGVLNNKSENTLLLSTDTKDGGSF